MGVPIATEKRFEAKLEKVRREAFLAGYNLGHDHTEDHCFMWCEWGAADVYKDWLEDLETGGRG